MRLGLELVVVASCIALGMTDAQSPPRARIVETLRLDPNTEDFSIVGPAKVGPKGQIAITFRQDGQIRVYDSTGKKLAAFGRKGQGPGEFANMQVQGWIGDTVWVYDHMLERHTFITQDGRLLRTVLLANTLIPTSRSSGTLTSTFAPHAMYSDGSMLGFACLREAPATPNASRQGVIHASATGATRVIGTVPENTTCGPPGQPGFRNPLVFAPQVVFRPDGRAFAQLRVDSVARSGGTFTVSMFDNTGAVTFAKSIPYVGEPMSSRTVDSVLAAAFPARGDDRESMQAAERGRTAARANVPPVRVPVTALLLGQDGTTWVHLRRPAKGEVALVLDARGNQVGLVPIPPMSTLFGASAKQMWVRERDADGQTSIVRYRIDGITCTGC